MNNKNCEQTIGLINDIEVEESSFDWVFKNYGPLYHNLCSTIRSPVFNFDIDPEIKWMFCVMFQCDDDKDLIEVYLKEGSVKSTNICVELSLLNINEDVLESTKGKLVQDLAAESRVLYLFMKNTTELPDSTLIVRFKVCQHKLISNKISSYFKQKNEHQKFVGFEKLLNDEKFSDIKFIVDGRTINAHKNILSVQSAYFLAMFENDMKENQENSVRITDVSYEVMQEILRFIYCGKVNNMETLKLDLFVAADKYMIEGLKILCEEALILDLNIENVVDTLIIADQYDIKDLKTAALNYFTIHKREITTSDEFEKVVKTLPTSILTAMFKQLSY